jgi:hypothetical protein
MADDHVIDIRRFLGGAPEGPEEGAFAVWGGGGERSRFALPLWRAIYLAGGEWGGIISLSRHESRDVTRPLFVLDLKRDPARIFDSAGSLSLLRGEEAPALALTGDRELSVLLGADGGTQWFLQIRGGSLTAAPDGRSRETLLFLAGECAGLLFFRELATLLPFSSSTP